MRINLKTESKNLTVLYTDSGNIPSKSIQSVEDKNVIPNLK